jgi:hypothetical protein
VAAPLDHPFNSVDLAFEDGFDLTVPAVANPAGHPLLMRLTATGVAKEHALNPAADVDVTSDGHLLQVCRSSCGGIAAPPCSLTSSPSPSWPSLAAGWLSPPASPSAVGPAREQRRSHAACGPATSSGRPWCWLRSAAAAVLIQLPGLSFGWWTAIGGTGNVILGSTNNTSGTVLVWLVPLAFLALLIPALALFAEREEVVFRSGAEEWTWGQRFAMGLRFGLVHLIMGIPIAVALALAIGGWYFQWAYLRGYREGGREAGVLESTRSHLAYNLEVLLIVAVYLVGLAS